MAEPKHLAHFRELRMAGEGIVERAALIRNVGEELARTVNHYQAACGAVSDAWAAYMSDGRRENTDGIAPVIDAIDEMRDTMRRFGQEV